MGGLIHVGAFDASEYDPIIRPRPLLLIEPQRIPFLKAADRFRDDVHFRNVACGEPRFALLKSCPMHPASASLYPPEKHLEVFPEMRYEGTETVRIQRLDDIVPEGDFTDLIVDAQGSELDVLRSGTETLRRIKRIRCEVSTVEMFKGQALLPQIDSYLADRGFTRTITDLRFRGVHGDAYYVK